MLYGAGRETVWGLQEHDGEWARVIFGKSLLTASPPHSKLDTPYVLRLSLLENSSAIASFVLLPVRHRFILFAILHQAYYHRFGDTLALPNSIHGRAMNEATILASHVSVSMWRHMTAVIASRSPRCVAAVPANLSNCARAGPDCEDSHTYIRSDLRQLLCTLAAVEPDAIATPDKPHRGLHVDSQISWMIGRRRAQSDRGC